MSLCDPEILCCNRSSAQIFRPEIGVLLLSGMFRMVLEIPPSAIPQCGGDGVLGPGHGQEDQRQGAGSGGAGAVAGT